MLSLPRPSPVLKITNKTPGLGFTNKPKAKIYLKYPPLERAEDVNLDSVTYFVK